MCIGLIVDYLTIENNVPFIITSLTKGDVVINIVSPLNGNVVYLLRPGSDNLSHELCLCALFYNRGLLSYLNIYLMTWRQHIQK